MIYIKSYKYLGYLLLMLLGIAFIVLMAIYGVDVVLKYIFFILLALCLVCYCVGVVCLTVYFMFYLLKRTFGFKSRKEIKNCKEQQTQL